MEMQPPNSMLNTTLTEINFDWIRVKVRFRGKLLKKREQLKYVMLNYII